MEPQTATTQTLYAQLFEESVAHAISIFENGIIGSPYINVVRGVRYIYWQIKLPDGSFKRKSLGRESPETIALVEGLISRKQAASEAITAMKSTSRAFVASGGMSIEAAHFKVIEWLAMAGLFSKGVIVVGSHAFTSIGNLLGVRWGSSLKTSDMDFARPASIALAIPDSGEHIDIPEIVKAGDSSFFEVPRLNLKEPSTSMMSRKSRVKIDFLTTQKKRDDATPHYFPDLSIAAEPLKFMDYLIGDRLLQGLIVGPYAIPITLPDPARFALHKLVIAQERSLAFQAKIEKDLAQASEVILALLELGRDDDLRDAGSALRQHTYGSPLAKVAQSAKRLNGSVRQAIEAILA